MSRLRVGTKLGRDTTWTANPNWPRGYSMPYNALLNKENWGKGILGEVVFVIGWRLLGHQSPCGRWWVIAFASLLGSSLPFSFIYLSVFISNHEFSCFCASYSLPCHTGGGGMNKELWCLAAGQGQLTRGEEEVKKVRKKGSGPIYPSELCLFQYARNMLMWKNACMDRNTNCEITFCSYTMK